MPTPRPRTTVPDVDALLGIPVPVLDAGHCTLVSYLGSDADIVAAARTSYGDGTRTLRDDATLINYLMAHHHDSPFEFVETVWHLRLPIFVMRQLVRHRTASISELSGRYSILPDDAYIPDFVRIGAQSEANKQGTGAALPANLQRQAAKYLAENEAESQDVYLALLDMGVARETARQATTVSRYTECYFKMDLRNLLHLLHLRLDPHAQWEVREYAAAMERIVTQLVPLTHAAWVEHVRDAATFSATEMRLLRTLLTLPGTGTPGQARVDALLENSGLSPRARREFVAKLEGA